MRFAGWFCLALGVVCTLAALGLGIRALQQATEISAYHNAGPCPAGAAVNADCLRAVHGSVVAVTESPAAGRIPANFSLDVRTASATLRLTFNSDSPMLGYAVDGDPAVVTLWRGRPVSVVTDGRSAVTTSVPETALAHDLGNGEEAGGVGVLFVIGALAIRRNRKADGTQQQLGPVVSAAMLALVLGAIVVLVSGIALGGQPSRLGPDLAVTGAALAVVLGLSAWAGIAANRHTRIHQVALARAGLSDAEISTPRPAAPSPHRRVPRAAHLDLQARAPLRARLRSAGIASVLRTHAAGWLSPALTVGVLFALFLTSHDGPQARAYRHAPACVGETNLATCAGDFTAVINGVRTPTNGNNSADVSYATPDGAVNQWGTFGGNSAVIARTAIADEKARTLLLVRVWRGAIVGAELGGSWQWTWGNPPGNTNPTIFLAISFALLLFVVRLGMHRRAGSGARIRRLLFEDAGQVVAATGSVVLLASGFWPGVVLALGTLGWLALSVRQSTHPGEQG